MYTSVSSYTRIHNSTSITDEGRRIDVEICPVYSIIYNLTLFSDTSVACNGWQVKNLKWITLSIQSYLC